jgi:hypothetical protein
MKIHEFHAEFDSSAFKQTWMQRTTEAQKVLMARLKRDWQHAKLAES